MTKTAEISKASGQLAELVKQDLARDEILLTQGNRAVARLVSADAPPARDDMALQICALPVHWILTPAISQTELADELL